MTVLVADDNSEYRKDLLVYLQKLDGVKVVGQAEDGAEAAKLALVFHPDLVLMDISMPHVGGIEAAQRIKSVCPDTKVAFLTIHEENTYKMLADMLCVDGFICKSSAKTEIPRLLRRMRATMQEL